jgi:hypothetical protein
MPPKTPDHPRIPPIVQELVLPDASIEILEPVWCNQVTFRVTFDPGTLPLTGLQVVMVTVIDNVSGVDQAFPSLPFGFPPIGGSATATYSFPMPPDATFQPDWANEIRVRIEPRSQADRDPSNDEAVATGFCVG